MSLRTSLWIDLAGNLQARANQFLGSMQRFGQGSTRSVNALNRSLEAAGQRLDRMGNRYTAFLSGAAGYGAVRQVGNMSMRLTRLGINAEKDAQTIDNLYQKILKTAQMEDIRVDPEELLSGVEKIVQKLGDLDLASDHLRTLGIVIQATGAKGEEAGDMIANFKEKFKLSDSEILPAFDTLVRQAHAGAFELKDMVTQGNRITAAYGSMGRTGMSAVREMGAMMQVFNKSAGSSEEVATAWKNLFNDLMEPSKKKYLQALKVNIWDPEKLKEGKKQVRSIVDIMDELLVKTKGDPEKLNRIFGMQSLDGVKALITEYQASQKNMAKDFYKMDGDGTAILKESARAAKEFNSAMQNLHTSWQRFARNNLTGPIQSLANALNSLDPKTVDLWLKVATVSAATLGGAMLLRKGWNIYKWGRDLMKGKPGQPGMGLPGIPGAGNAIPVYVVNMPGSLGGPSTVPSIPGGVGGAGGAAKKLPGFLKMLPWLALGKAGLYFAGGYAVGSGINWGVNRAVSAASGGQYDAFGALFYDLLHKDAARSGNERKTEVGGELKISIQDDRVVVKDLKSNNPNFDLDVDTGLTMRWP